jgi:4-amino-4-deoxy-L-arabinose transferase-like glycosyltransferase
VKSAWIAAGAAALLLLPGLGRLDLWAPDEPRYAQVAEELRSAGPGLPGRVLLHLNGEPYTQKPPLFFWLAALAGAVSGRVGETAARLPSALAGVLTVAVVARLGTRLLGAQAGLLGAGMLLTAWEFAWRARRAQLDVLLTFFEVTALAAFWRLFTRGPSRATLALLHVALGLAVLTKGPVGWLVPFLAMTTFLAWEGRLRELPRLAPPWALALSLGPGLAWIAAATALGPPGFADEALVQNLLGRFFQGTSHARSLPYYALHLPLSFLPWTLLAPWAVREARRRVFADGADPGRARAWRFLLAWLGSSFVFFSLSAGKRALYLLPVFPALALLCADGAVAGGARARRLGACVAAVLALELGIALGLLPRLEAEKSPRVLAEAAAAVTPPDAPVGLLAKRTLVGGIAYYADRPVRVLASVRDAADFVAGGGRAVVVRERDRKALEALAPVDVIARARSGPRALAVVAGRLTRGSAPGTLRADDAR